MIVILEGSDLTGRSSLAASLTAAHGWPIAKIRWNLLGGTEIETRHGQNHDRVPAPDTTPDHL